MFREWIRGMRLSKRLGLMIGIFTVISFVILNVIVGALFTGVINKTSERSMNDIAAKNVAELEFIVERNEVLVRPLVNSLIEMHKEVDDNDDLYPSVVLDGVDFVESRCDREIMIMSTLKSIVNSNENVDGAGAIFVPNMYQKNVKEFAPYLTREDVENDTITRLTFDTIKDKDYYLHAVEEGREVYGIPVKSEITGEMVVPAIYPIISDGDLMGAIRIDLRTSVFDSMLVSGRDTYESLVVEIDTGNQYVVYSNNESSVGKSVSDLLPQASVEFYKEKMAEGKPFMRENTGVRRYYTPVQVGADTWWVHTAVTVKELMKDQNVSIMIMSVVQIVTLVLLLLVLTLALKCSLKPLDGMAKLAKGISHGNLSGSFEYPYKDEIGDLVANLQYMAERFRRIIEDLDVQLEELSEGNLSHDAYDESLYEGDFASLHASVANIKEHLNDTLLNIRNVAESVNSGSEQVDAGAQILAQGATEQAASIEELNAEMARIHDGVRDTSKKTTDASDLSHDGNAVIKESNEKMHELTAAMADITEKSNEISKIIKTIDDIAFQTNILALNAAVEAARAGDSGKGFAVVADEVRNLAGKSAKAAKSTAQLIQGALDAVKNGETITVQTAEALERAAKNTEQVTSLVEDIATTMTEQATAVDTVTFGLDQISSVVQTNSATAEESAAASGELSKQATELNSLIGRFQLKD